MADQYLLPGPMWCMVVVRLQAWIASRRIRSPVCRPSAIGKDAQNHSQVSVRLNVAWSTNQYSTHRHGCLGHFRREPKLLRHAID